VQVENIARRHLSKRGLAVLAAVVTEQFSIRRERLGVATQLMGQRLAASRADQTALKLPGGNELENSPTLCMTVMNKHRRFFTDRK
jgi:hypothetical protein